jgi:3D-(3,5/4)-trihydroxycyclohexane-1,2-dione acylhydrolase (decyclizing)
MSTIRLTMAQALVRFLAAQKTEVEGEALPLFAGVWAIFGHGNVAGMGEALHGVQDRLPTFRAHNEQAMAHAATAFAKASRRRRIMACTTSIGPGATNMVTAAAVAHVNRLPLLLLPGDVFANRRPDPVLQQVEDFGDGTISANDCFRPVSRYFDRIARPEQLIPALARTMQVLTDPAECGPVTLGLCQDTQTEAYDYPETFFAERVWSARRVRPDERELADAVALLRKAKKPFIIAGGGVLFSEAERQLAEFAVRHGIPVAETQAGKSSLAHDHPLNLGSVGVTGTGAANAMAEEADVVLAVGTRLQDFTTGSWSLFKGADRRIVGLNIQPFDAMKHAAQALVCDARVGLDELTRALGGWTAEAAWTRQASDEKARWIDIAARYTGPTNADLPSDAQVIGAVQRASDPSDIVVCAAGGLPGELHKLWNAAQALGYHMEYGYSCMG